MVRKLLATLAVLELAYLAVVVWLFSLAPVEPPEPSQPPPGALESSLVTVGVFGYLGLTGVTLVAAAVLLWRSPGPRGSWRWRLDVTTLSGLIAVHALGVALGTWALLSDPTGDAFFAGVTVGACSVVYLAARELRTALERTSALSAIPGTH